MFLEDKPTKRKSMSISLLDTGSEKKKRASIF